MTQIHIYQEMRERWREAEAEMDVRKTWRIMKRMRHTGKKMQLSTIDSTSVQKVCLHVICILPHRTKPWSSAKLTSGNNVHISYSFALIWKYSIEDQFNHEWMRLKMLVGKLKIPQWRGNKKDASVSTVDHRGLFPVTLWWCAAWTVAGIDPYEKLNWSDLKTRCALIMPSPLQF